MSLELLEKAKADRAWLMDCMSDQQEEDFRDWLIKRTRVLADSEESHWTRNLENVPTKKLVDHPYAVLMWSRHFVYKQMLRLEVDETCLHNRFLVYLSTREQK